MKTWRLYISSIIPLLVLSASLLLAFWALAWLTDSLKIPEFLRQAFSRGTPTSLVIDVFPADSTILLNDKPYAAGSMPVPGDHTVRVSHDGYFPTEENIRIHPNQENRFAIQLMPIATVQRIADHAKLPGWDEEGNLFFLNLAEGAIYKWSIDATSPVIDLVGEIYQLLYAPAGTHAIALAQEGPESGIQVYQADLQTGEFMDLPATRYVYLGPDGKTVWGINPASTDSTGKPVWSAVPGEDPQMLALENPELAHFGNRLSVDPSGQWLAVESLEGVGVWEISSGKLLATLENSFGPIWVQNPQPGLVYLGADQSLYFAQANHDWTSMTLLPTVETPVAGMPGGPEIVFTRYNPFLGGSSFWALDLSTLGVRLLSEAAIESGHVEQFSISSDGKKIAFINQESDLYLITLEP